jgi:hypothetical protein
MMASPDGRRRMVQPAVDREHGGRIERMLERTSIAQAMRWVQIIENDSGFDSMRERRMAANKQAVEKSY